MATEEKPNESTTEETPKEPKESDEEKKIPEYRLKEKDGILFIESGFDPETGTCIKAHSAKCKSCIEDDLTQPGLNPCLKEKEAVIACANENVQNSRKACKSQQDAFKKCSRNHKPK